MRSQTDAFIVVRALLLLGPICLCFFEEESFRLGGGFRGGDGGVTLGFLGLDFKVCDFCTLAGSLEVLEGPEETPLVSARGWFSRL